MNWYHRSWTTLAAGQVVLVVCGAAGWLPDRRSGPAAEPLLWYAEMSGADNQYSFYAPEVGASYRARFTLRDSHGGYWPASFEDTATPEARLRLSEIAASGFANDAAREYPERRVQMVKSWAAAMFHRHPSATSLAVVVEAYDVPTMAEYRAGRHPEWVAVYRAEVQRTPAAPGTGASP